MSENNLLIEEVIEAINNTPPSLSELLSKSRINYGDEIIEPPVCISINCDHGESIIGTMGNFSLVMGKAKSRKTYFTSLIVSRLLTNDNDKIRTYLKPGKDKILFFDTEQSGYHVQKVLRRIISTAKITDKETNRVALHCLRPFGTAKRLELIEYALYNTPGVGVAIIDGIRDLVKDINSAEEAAMICDRLLKWTAELNIHIVVVLHQNKADNNARGHLGAEITNKAETVIQIAKDAQNPDLSIVSSEYLRDIDFKEFAFGIDEDKLPYLINDWTTQKKESKTTKASAPNIIADEFHLLRLGEAFKSGENLTYEPTWRAIKNSFLGFQTISDNKAKDFLTYYQQKGWIIKVEARKKGNMHPVYELSRVV